MPSSKKIVNSKMKTRQQDLDQRTKSKHRLEIGNLGKIVSLWCRSKLIFKLLFVSSRLASRREHLAHSFSSVRLSGLAVQ